MVKLKVGNYTHSRRYLLTRSHVKILYVNRIYIYCPQEYEEGASPEAVVVKDLDKFDMMFQAFEYEKGLCMDMICSAEN